MLIKKYEVIKDGPKEFDWGKYEEVVINEFNILLSDESNDESAFQSFFEKNPSFIPGALSLFGQSGHYPYMHTIISQPQIGNAFKKFPDFVWLANDSLTFTPVFVEIESPSKKMFNINGTPTAKFTQAKTQIDEWMTIMTEPVNQLSFYDFFDIPQHIREKTFKPQYLLIYGRRSEYEENALLRGIRYHNTKENFAIYSYDRLKPLADYRQFITCKVNQKKYNVLSIVPTFRYRADCSDKLARFTGFYEAIDLVKHITPERKQFLKCRYKYWCDFGKTPNKGVIISGEGE